MRIEFSSNGDLLIKPDGVAERLALAAWIDQKKFGEGSEKAFVIDLTPPPLPPNVPVDGRHVHRLTK